MELRGGRKNAGSSIKAVELALVPKWDYPMFHENYRAINLKNILGR